MGRNKPDDVCVCGRAWCEHIEVDLRAEGEGMLLLCPGNVSGFAPSKFRKKRGDV